MSSPPLSRTLPLLFHGGEREGELPAAGGQLGEAAQRCGARVRRRGGASGGGSMALGEAAAAAMDRE